MVIKFVLTFSKPDVKSFSLILKTRFFKERRFFFLKRLGNDWILILFNSC